MPWCSNSTSDNSTETSIWSINDICKNMPLGRMIQTIIEAVAFLLGFPSSVALMWELVQRYRTGSSNSTSDIFILNSAAVGMIYNSSLLLNVLNMLIFRNSIIKEVTTSFYSVSMTGVPLFVTSICLDCYLAVVRPIVYMATKGLHSRVIVSAVIWVYMMSSGLVIFLKILPFNSPLTLISYYITLSVSVFCNFSILRTLRTPGPGGRDLHPTKKKAFQTILTILVILVVCLLPPVAVLSFQKSMCKPSVAYHCILAPTIMTFPTICCCVIPMIFLFSLGKLTCCQK